jgi:hypothetical protein
MYLLVIVIGCTSTKTSKRVVANPDVNQKFEENMDSHGTTGNTFTGNFGMDNHFAIWLNHEVIIPMVLDSIDSLTQSVKLPSESEIASHGILPEEFSRLDYSEVKSAVADKIVANYLYSKNKEPGGHCLRVSKRRFEKAYEGVHGHSFYDDLPDSIATSYYTPKEVFDYLYVSASGTHEGWRSLPIKYRGKGNAGAIAYAGMGTLVDWFGIWSGKLKPGAPMQVWKHRKDYEKVVRGVSKKNFDPFGHSFIFISYVRNEKGEIIGIKIADQGYQSYRLLVPDDYEVWWAVNLSI